MLGQSNSFPESRQKISVADHLLFFALFSGPPKFRLRDPNASLYAEIDWVVVLHVVVWALAGVWIANKLWLSRSRVEFRLSSVEKLSLLFVCCLAVSAFFSEAPQLATFKVYQLLVTILFASLFVRSYGCRAAFEAILCGSTILCVADVLAAVIAPEMVFGESEFGSLRFRGDLVAQTGVVGVLALVLLLTGDRKRHPITTAGGIVLFGSVTLFSLMRTSYLAILAFLLLALWKAPDIKLKRFARWAVVAVPIAAIGGALAHLEEYRPAESIWTLSDRIGLWAYLLDTMWTKSRWFGLGYFSASRIYGPEFNPGLGTAHSVFIEVLCGGGIVSFVTFLSVWCFLVFYALRLLRGPLTPKSFTAVGLLLVTSSFVLIGSELEADPAGFTLWILVASVPLLFQQLVKKEARSGPRPGMATRHPPLPNLT